MGLRTLAVALALALVFPTPRAEADDYPARNVTMIVPFAAGSGADAVARILSNRLGDALGTRIIIENRAGANGAIGATAAARAAPDGHTLLLTSNTTHSANPSLLKSISYDPLADFAPIARVGNFVYFLVTGPSAPKGSVAELVVHAKAHPGELSYAYGNGTGIVAAEAFKTEMGIDVLKVPYKSTPPALTDLMAGRVSMMFVDMPSSHGHVRSGALRALAVSTQTRSAIVADVPSMAEVGVPNLDITAWAAVFAPAGTPPAIVARLNKELRAIIGDPDIKAKLATIGFDAFSGSPEELRGFVAAELVKWTSLVKAAGIQPE